MSDNVQTLTGGSVKLYCNFEGNPKPSIEWFHRNLNTDEAPTRVPNYGPVQSILEIENATYSHEGKFKLRSKNEMIWEGKIVTIIYLSPSSYSFHLWWSQPILTASLCPLFLSFFSKIFFSLPLLLLLHNSIELLVLSPCVSFTHFDH